MKKVPFGLLLTTILSLGLAGSLALATFGAPGLLTPVAASSVGDSVLHLGGMLTVEAFRGNCATEAAKDEARTALAGLARRLLRPLSCERFAVRGPMPNTVLTTGKVAIRDCMNANNSSACTATLAVFKYHGLGTDNTASGAGDTGCTVELTTQYNPDGTRATGSQTTNGATVYRTIGTNTVDNTAAVVEWCLMNQATTGGTGLSHVVFSTVNLGAGDGLQTTYDFTVN